MEGLENTLLIFGHRLKHNIQVVRDYAPNPSKVWAFGSELNQVWTNLIDNALDAMGEEGTLHILNQGSIRVESRPGNTCFQIRLPIR